MSVWSGIGSPAEDPVLVPDRGFEIYRDHCMDCHLTTGMGIREMNAPSTAGLPRWYITDQLRKFRRDERGSHDEDTAGTLMQIKARGLGERELAFVGKYIESLPPNKQRNTLDLPVTTHGQDRYATACADCHGDQGEGLKSKRAPPLTRQPDWYLLKQLENFRAGKREHTNDPPYLEISIGEAEAIIAWLAALPLVAESADD